MRLVDHDDRDPALLSLREEVRVEGVHRIDVARADLHALLSKTLSKEQLAELYGKMFVQINLNTAAPSEILLIPGMGNQMLREFQEYRPYRTITQFRKEIGKYVDQKEVARLEQYVFVPINLNSTR